MWNLGTFLIIAILASAGIAGVLTLIVAGLQRQPKTAPRAEYQPGITASAQH